MGDAYPMLRDERERILAAIAREEVQFARTLDAGTVQLEEALIPLTDAERVVGRRPEDVPPNAPVLPGAFAFKLHDTYGFPIDLTIELAAEYGVRVDRGGFDAALEEQRQRSRGGRKAELARHAQLTDLYEGIQRRAGETVFVGYETTAAEGRVLAILRDGIAFDDLSGSGEAEVILDRTPFYAEGGGQVGDQGELLEAGGGSRLFSVEETLRPAGRLVVHHGKLHGRIRTGETVSAVVDGERRARTMRNHTATHLLHRALRNAVGPAARQAGSLVAPDYLRFDYPFERALTEDERRRIEDEVRRVVREDRPVTVALLPIGEAIEAGADAFFDEKYGEVVRTVRVADYSFELCGGTHCGASGQVGGFVITADRSIGTGMRRIEALTGDAADAHLRQRAELLAEIAGHLGAQGVEAVPDRIAALEAELREAKRRLRAGSGPGVPKAAELVAAAREVAPGIRLVAQAGHWATIEELKATAKETRSRLPSGVIALGLDADQPQLFVGVSDDLVARGVSAGALVQVGMAHIEGKGGGRPEMAQGRGSRRDGLAAALEAIGASLVAGSGG
jgi:alanyl-tRNA synthetase